MAEAKAKRRDVPRRISDPERWWEHVRSCPSCGEFFEPPAAQEEG